MSQLFLILGVQCYWASIVFIGLCVVHFLIRRSGGRLGSRWQNYPVFVKFLVSAAVGFGVFIGVTLVGYALRLPAGFAACVYLIMLLWAVYFAVFVFGGAVLAFLKGPYMRFAPAGVLLLLVLAFDFIHSIWVGGYMNGDAIVHISKIRHLLDYGFNLTDAYFGTVPETRHTLSVIHTMYVVPSWLGIDPLNVWYYSLAFFRLLRWASLFLLVWLVTGLIDKNRKDTTVYIASVFAILLGSGAYTMQYPGNIAGIWAVLFIAGLIDFWRSGSWRLLLLASLLLTFTHPLAALSGVILLSIVLAASIVCNRRSITRRKLLLTGAFMLILLSTPLFTQLLPDRMTEFARNYGMERYSFYELGSLVGRQPVLPKSWLDITLWLGSAIGYVYVYLKGRNNTDRSRLVVLASVALFIPLVLCNPFTYSLMSNVLPAWALQRLNIMSQLGNVMFFFGLWAVCVMIGLAFQKWSRQVAMASVCLAIVALAPFLQSFDHMPKSKDSVHRMNKDALTLIEFEKDRLLPRDPNAIVFDDIYRAFYFSAVANVHVVAILESSATPAADMNSRTACYNKIHTTLNPALLKQAGVDYVIAWHSDGLYGIAKHSPYLQEQVTLRAPNDLGLVTRYKVLPYKGVAPGELCVYNEN